MALLISEVERAYLIDEDGGPKKFVSLYIRPIRLTDAADAKALLGRFATFSGKHDLVIRSCR